MLFRPILLRGVKNELEKKLIVIVPAAGAGKRLGIGVNKAFAMLQGAPLLVHCLQMLDKTQMVQRAVVVLAPQEIDDGYNLLTSYQKEYFPDLAFSIVAGGKERQDSVYNALKTITEDDCYIAVHDGARPFANREIFARTLAAAMVYGAAVASIPVKDTIKIIDEDGIVTATPKRNSLQAVQTPQIFQAKVLKEAYSYLAKYPAEVTDDASIVELMHRKVAVALGSYENIKITTPEDLIFAENFLARQEKNMNHNPKMPIFRVGCGFDVHKLAEKRKLILCGVEVPYELGLLGHSDADVAVHALMDALLGAAALGDIGKHFPDNDMNFKDADSMKLLAHVVKLLVDKGYQINNVDVTIIAQRPKLADYIPRMRANLAEVMQIGEDSINVKATTTEKLGFTGRGEGLAAESVVSIMHV